ncbi:MAG: Holliday junction branch migration protein RuvA [Armatimonadota bacterium]|nr:Holliday junction branch migration protein RuvA [Armatimonadota bacterium]
MIGYLRGRIVRRGEGVIVLEVGGVGYEVALPPIVEAALPSGEGEAVVELFISYHATANQPKPLLVGFLREVEQEFFERFVTVDGVGPTRAVRAMVRQVHEIADAIERRDAAFLRRLPGIGSRTAEKVIAELHGKMGKYALLREEAAAAPAPPDFKAEVIDVLVRQLGHRAAEARRMVEEALQRAPHVDSAEALFQEVYRLERGTPR